MDKIKVVLFEMVINLVISPGEKIESRILLTKE